MKRAQIYVEDDEYEALRAKAFQEHTSISKIVRGLVRVSIIGRPEKKRHKAQLLDGIIGIVHDTKTDVAERHDEYLWGEAT